MHLGTEAPAGDLAFGGGAPRGSSSGCDRFTAPPPRAVPARVTSRPGAGPVPSLEDV